MNIVYREKVAAWTRTYWIDFGKFAELQAGEVITGTPTVTVSPAGLTLGAISVSGTVVNVQLSGGTAGISYVLTATIMTSGGATLNAQVGLTVV